ncbi:MAG: hypothetical protein R6U66_10005 [Bacteroidales bacterium]|jgi:hypothetical protein
MEELRKNIQQNRGLFDTEEPSDGHMERFAQKLAQTHKRRSRFSFGYLLKAAAITLLLVLSGLWVYEHTPYSEPAVKLTSLGDISPEYREVEQYYVTTVNNKYNEIRQFDFQDEAQQKMLLEELKAMDAIYDELQQDLQANPGDERVIHAMIQHYQIKVKVMNQIITQLQTARQVKTEKNNNHENTKTI